MAQDSEAAPDSATVTVRDAAHFEDLLASADLVVADFYGDWLGPRVGVEDVLETVAADGGATVAKVDVEVNTPLADEYAVRDLPTVIVFRDGDPAERLVGLADPDRLRRLADRYVDDSSDSVI